MAAPYNDYGLISKAITWARTWANEPLETGLNPLFSNSALSEILYDSLDAVIEDLYGAADGPPYAEYTISLSPNQKLYMIPPNVKEVRRVIQRDSNKNIRFEVIPGSRLSGLGPGVVLEGTRFLSFDPLPRFQGITGSSILVQYIPGGPSAIHQQACPVWSGDNDTGVQLLTSSSWRVNYTTSQTIAWLLGRIDRRPSSFLGASLRVLGTNADVAVPGYGAFPVQERKLVESSRVLVSGTASAIAAAGVNSDVTASSSVFAAGHLYSDIKFTVTGNRYRIMTYTSGTVVRVLGDATAETGAFDVVGGPGDYDISPALDFNPAAITDKAIVQSPDSTGRTYLICEVLPDVDSAIFDIAALDMAIRVCEAVGRKEQRQILISRRAARLRTAQLRWANAETRAGDTWDTSERDESESFI